MKSHFIPGENLPCSPLKSRRSPRSSAPSRRDCNTRKHPWPFVCRTLLLIVERRQGRVMPPERAAPASMGRQLMTETACRYGSFSAGRSTVVNGTTNVPRFRHHANAFPAETAKNTKSFSPRGKIAKKTARNSVFRLTNSPPGCRL